MTTDRVCAKCKTLNVNGGIYCYNCTYDLKNINKNKLRIWQRYIQN